MACRTLDGTAFILLASRMVSLNEVGTFIWERFQNAATLEDVVQSVDRVFLEAATQQSSQRRRRGVRRGGTTPRAPRWSDGC